MQRLRMSQRPQLLKLLTSERDGVVWQCYRWMLLLRVVLPPECIGFACFFSCKWQMRKSEKQNQTFPRCPFSCHVLSGNNKQYWCCLETVGKGSSTSKCWLRVLTAFSCRGSFQSATLPVFGLVRVVELVTVGRETWNISECGKTSHLTYFTKAFKNVLIDLFVGVSPIVTTLICTG